MPSVYMAFAGKKSVDSYGKELRGFLNYPYSIITELDSEYLLAQSAWIQFVSCFKVTSEMNISGVYTPLLSIDILLQEYIYSK